ncbi:LysR family transcriptional regulator [Sphingobium sp. BYY-5]|uniref:LysR family transcriptional regulator n=1 Tax=Sphingobium sp. BYY-5 TaxID=2926400 RepID=UPI001FA78310|nr:LysR family transcriptional regulator [Sphingobium sp. BYY-5]MCI4591907.1 LysR family transcriptional regulator [Sphingobium sp. BYY-5]
MRRDRLIDLNAFLSVADEQSFTRAAAKLNVSQSALSHTIRRLETHLGVRLLTRTTRRVSVTEAGQKLVDTLRPALDDIDRQLAAIVELGDKPSGTIRITSSRRAAETILWPALKPLLRDYPEIKVEVSIDSSLTDIVAERLDAGIRLGEQLAKDMIAVRIGPEQRMAVVGSPAYFENHPKPLTPQDLADHSCVNLRLLSAGGLYAWEMEKNGREIRVRVDGQIIFNDAQMVIKAAMDGFGLACTLEDHVLEQIADGTLIRVLEEWCPPFPGYHLYYPSRRQQSAAFTLLVEALRYRG